jgi:two-component system, NarL family, sensor histidine kinase DesK
VRVYDSRGVTVEPRPDVRVDWLIRVASAGAIASGVAFALVGLAVHAVMPERDHLPVAVGATAVALALHVRHLRYALEGRRAPGARWTLAALAVLIIGPVPLIGAAWLTMFHVLAASAYLVLRPRWAVPAYLGIAVAAGLWAVSLETGLVGPPAGWAAWFGLSVISRGFAPIVLVWLVVALRQVEAARQALATEAVEIERQRIAGEFRRSVGGELEELVAQGVRATELAAAGLGTVEPELQVLVSRSRQSLSAARHMLRGYTLPARTELEGAVALLHAAGVDVTLELADRELPATLDERVRAALRELTNELLHEDDRRVTLTLLSDAAGLRLEHRIDGGRMSSTEPVA